MLADLTPKGRNFFNPDIQSNTGDRNKRAEGGLFSRPLRLGQLGGKAVEIEWGWLGLALIIGYLIFPFYLPGANWLQALSLSLTGVLLFVLAGVVHEAAHVKLAAARGYQVEKIRLGLFGGCVATGEARFTRPVDHLLVTGAGPAANFGLALAAGALATTLAWAGGPFLLTILFGYTAYLNLLMALINLIPCLPMDGGRIVQAGLWRLLKDEWQATRWAGRVGQITGYSLIIVGAAVLILTGRFDGLALMVAGWLVAGSAGAYRLQAAVERGLANMRVGELAEPPAVTANTQTPVCDPQFHKLLIRSGGLLPVVENGYLCGVVTMSDYNNVVPRCWETARAQDIMQRRNTILTMSPDQPALTAYQQLTGREQAYLAVLNEDGSLAGLVRLNSLIQAALHHDRLNLRR